MLPIVSEFIIIIVITIIIIIVVDDVIISELPNVIGHRAAPRVMVAITSPAVERNNVAVVQSLNVALCVPNCCFFVN